jgi:hypothetical protein
MSTRNLFHTNDIIPGYTAQQSRTTAVTTKSSFEFQQQQQRPITTTALLSSLQNLHQKVIREECQQALQPKVLKRSNALHPALPPPPVVPVSFKTGRPIKPSNTSSSSGKGTSSTSTTNTSSDKWFYMRSTPMTKELQMDLDILRNRNYLDPKRFYKSSNINKKNTTNMTIQVGTVIEGPTEYYSQRYTNKERSTTFMNEIMKDSKIHNYTTSKYKTMQQQQTMKSKQKRSIPHSKKKSIPVFKKR